MNYKRLFHRIGKVAFLALVTGCTANMQIAQSQTVGDTPKKSAQFLISIFWAPPWEYTNDKHYDYLKEAHINLVPCVHPSLSPHGRSSRWPTDVNDTEERVAIQRKILDLAEDRGMQVAVKDPRIYNDVKAVVEDFKDHPALWGYYLVDEPGRKEFKKYGRIYREFMKHDPEHTPFINMLPGPRDSPYRRFLREWIDAVGSENLHYLVFDNYPFASTKFDDLYYGRGRSHGHIPDYCNDLETVRKLGLEHNIKTGLYLQSVGIKGYLRRPDTNDLRWNVYTALAYGVKSIQWFTWWTPSPGKFTDAIIDRKGNKTDIYEAVKQLNAQIQTLGPALMKLDAVNVYHSGVIPENLPEVPEDFFFKPVNPKDAVLVSHMIDRKNGRHYVMAVNKDNRSLKKHAEKLVLNGKKTLEFMVSGKINGLSRISKDTGKKVSVDKNLKDGVFSDSFLPGEGKIYVLPKSFNP